MSTDTISTIPAQKTPNDWVISDSNPIPTHPELNRIALKRSIDAEYLLWAVLRHVAAADGLSSHFTRELAYQIALTNGLSWSRRQFNRILQAGDGVFWKSGKSRIFLKSFKKVYNALADNEA